MFRTSILIAVNWKHLVKLKQRKTSINKQRLGCLICIFCMPFLWYLILQNHSYIHNWFTFRTLVPSLLALTVVGECLQREKNSQVPSCRKRATSVQKHSYRHRSDELSQPFFDASRSEENQLSFNSFDTAELPVVGQQK